jgi:hypothetical protein
MGGGTNWQTEGLSTRTSSGKRILSLASDNSGSSLQRRAARHFRLTMARLQQNLDLVSLQHPQHPPLPPPPDIAGYSGLLPLSTLFCCHVSLVVADVARNDATRYIALRNSPKFVPLLVQADLLRAARNHSLGFWEDCRQSVGNPSPSPGWQHSVAVSICRARAFVVIQELTLQAQQGN